MLKKVKLLAIVSVTLVLISGCDLKQKIDENITEGIIEKATGGEVDIEIDGDEVTFQSEDGEGTISSDEDGLVIESEDGTTISSGSEYEWPTEQAAAYLPELETGSVIYILNSETTAMISVEEITAEDYLAYEEAIVNAGYTEDKYESSAEDLEMYSGATKEGVAVSLIFTPSSNAMQVTVDSNSVTQ